MPAPGRGGASAKAAVWCTVSSTNTYLQDQAVSSADRINSAGDIMAGGEVPAQQSFSSAAMLVASKINDGRIGTRKRRQRSRGGYPSSKGTTRFDARIHLRSQEAVGPAPSALAPLPGQIGAFQELTRSLPSFGARPYRGWRGRDLMPKTIIRFADGGVV